MILLDVANNPNVTKGGDRYDGPTVRLPERAAGRSLDLQSLPDYDTSEQQHKVHQQPLQLKSWRPTQTFWKAAGSALAVYIVLSIAICTPFIIKEMRKEGGPPGPGPNGPFGSYLQALSNGPGIDARRPWDFSNLTCQRLSEDLFISSIVTSGDKTYYSTTLNYETLPIASHIRSNITRDTTEPALFNAYLDVDVATDVNQRLLKYQVTVNTTRGEPLDYTSLCFSETSGLHGLSIFPIQPFAGNEELSIYVHLTVPQGRPVRGLTTYLPNFTQRIRDLSTSYISMEGAFSPIVFESVSARDLTVRNVLAPIQGSVNVSFALDIYSVRGRVDTEINMYACRGEGPGPTVSIDGVESPLTLNLVLDGQVSSTIPTYTAEIQSVNGTVDIDITKSPQTIGSALGLNVECDMADTLVKVANSFSGWYDVGSTVGSVEVNDYTGSNRMSAEYTSAEKAVGVFDDPDPMSKSNSRGQFRIRTTFGQASLADRKSVV